MRPAIVLAAALLMSGCVSIGYHSRKLAEMRQADYEYAEKLARDVQIEKLRPKDMAARLKWRYKIQEELDAR